MPKDVTEFNVVLCVLELLTNPDYIDLMYEVLKERSKSRKRKPNLLNILYDTKENNRDID